MSFFEKHIKDFDELISRVPNELIRDVEKVSNAAADILKADGKVLAFGNGGSAVDASHFCAEFVGRFRRERRALPAISLTAETAVVTAVGNDYGYEKIFVREIEAFGRKGDIAFGLTTSGSSKNVLLGLKKAKELGLLTVALTGEKGLSEDAGCDFVLKVPSSLTYEIQEMHKIILHSICESVEEAVTK